MTDAMNGLCTELIENGDVSEIGSFVQMTEILHMSDERHNIEFASEALQHDFHFKGKIVKLHSAYCMSK